MAKKSFAELADNILAHIGGKDNISFATHCMTRLRLTLKDRSLVQEDEIKNLDGVLGTQWAGEQLQIIIGPNVTKVYAELCNKAGLALEKPVRENLDHPKEKLTVKSVISKVLDYVSGSMAAMIPALLGVGLCRVIATILGPNMAHIIEKEDNLYILLNLAYDSFFYYLPILIGFGAAKKLNIPAPMGALMGAVLLAPNYVNMVTNEQPFDFLGINIPLINYSQSMIPVLLSVALLALLYHFFAKVSPDIITTIVTPFLSILITVPITFIVLAPIGDIVSNAVADALTIFGNTTGFIGVGVVAALYNFLVMTGMHGPINMVFMTDYFEKGYMAGIASGGVASIWACYGVALGAFLRFKNKKEKSNALGYFISGFVGGITEPTLFGLCLKYRRCFIPMSIGAFVGGAYMGLTNVVRYLVGGGSNFLMLVKFTGGTTANLVNAVIGCLLAMAVATALTCIMGVTKEDKAEQNV